MKKLTLLFALLCSLSAFSVRYLVQGTGTNTWRTAGAGEVNVTLSTTLKAWYDATTMPSGTEVWLAAGTYSVTATITNKADVHLYGSFAGTETAVSERSKVSGGKLWEFTYKTTLDGNNSTGDFVGLGTTVSVNNTYIDGLEIIRFKRTGAASMNGGAVQLRAKVIMQNCIVSYNQFIGTTANEGKGAGVLIKDGQLLNSYIHHNDCLKGTGTGAAYGGGIAIFSSILCVVKGCTIESNTSTSSGGGIYLNDDGSVYRSGGTIEDCTFQSNAVLASNSQAGGGAIGGWANLPSITTAGLTIKNNQFIENTAMYDSNPAYGGGSGGAIYLNLTRVPVSIEGCSFIGNVSTAKYTDHGGGAINIASGVFTNSPIKNCIFRDNKITTGAGVEGSALLTRIPVTLQNCIFTNNSAVVSGSTLKIQADGCKVLNCVFANNFTTGTGRSIDATSKVFTLTNSVFCGNSVFANTFANATTGTTGTYNAFDTDQSAYAYYGTGSISTLTSSNSFVNPTTFIGIPSTSDGGVQKAASAASDWSLKYGCNAINAGSDLAALGVTTDILGNARPTGNGVVDMGAYEAVIVSSNQNVSDFATNSTINVSSGGHLTINTTKTVKNIISAPGTKLTLAAGNTLTATNGITLQSDATGTATMLNSGTYTGTITAEQYLGSARNWYVSSPVTNATSPATNITRYYEYVEAGDNADFSVNGSTTYWKGLNTGSPMTVGKGYIAQASAGTTVQFSGTPNNGNITTSFNLTRDDAKGKGFNLVGNPYPSYIDWSLVAQANTNLMSTAWFKTKKTDLAGGGYTFASVNVTTPSTPEIVANNANTTITKYIPPTQAFWVRVKSGTSSTSMSFTNAMREHRLDNGDLMKAPKVNERSRLRLQLVNGIESDETLIYFDKIATNDFNEYDSPKMMNNSSITPDLYSKSGTERLVINGMNAIVDIIELPLGFSLNAAAELKLRATEMSNFPLGTRIYLLDKVEFSQVELLPEAEYAFKTTTATTNNESRFNLLFRASGASTGISNTEKGITQVFVNAANQITIIAPVKSNYTIYNAVGQLIENGVTTSNYQTSNFKLQTGVYVVKVNNQSTRVIVK